MDGKKRCRWCNLKNPLYVAYHDEEWGRQNFEEGYLYQLVVNFVGSGITIHLIRAGAWTDETVYHTFE